MTVSVLSNLAAPGSYLWRAVRRAAGGIRRIHDEQVYTWECFWQASRASVARTGPLAWTFSLDGSRPSPGPVREPARKRKEEQKRDPAPASMLPASHGRSGRPCTRTL
jgi:hypothetical protein